MQRSLVSAACIALLCSTSFPALAASGSTLEEDLRQFERVRAQIGGEESMQVQELSDEHADEFFPLPPGVMELYEPPSDFVTVPWGGKHYDLTDVPRKTWFAPYVRDMVARGIVTGYRDASGAPNGSFGPERPVSIEEVAKMVLAAAGTDPDSCSAQPRNAMAAGRWSKAYIACAEDRNLTLFQYPALNLARPAHRGEVVLTLLEAFTSSASGSVATASGSSPPVAPAMGSGSQAGSGSIFKDVTPERFDAPAILRASRDGIISGYKDVAGEPTGYFGPDNPITRAEVSKVLSLALQVYAKKVQKKSAVQPVAP